MDFFYTIPSCLHILILNPYGLHRLPCHVIEDSLTAGQGSPWLPYSYGVILAGVFNTRPRLVESVDRCVPQRTASEAAKSDDHQAPPRQKWLGPVQNALS